MVVIMPLLRHYEHLASEFHSKRRYVHMDLKILLLVQVNLRGLGVTWNIGFHSRGF